MDKKKFQLEFFSQFIKEKGLEDEWKKFQAENTFELAKIFRNQDGIRESYNEFLVDVLGISPETGVTYEQEKPTISATEMNILMQSAQGQEKLKKMGYLKNEQY